MLSRRHFIGASGAAGAMGLASGVLDQPQSKVSPNGRVQIALIGAGGMGCNDARTALNVGGVEIVAVSDVYEARLKQARDTWGRHLLTSRDYREVLVRPDVDAVIIATPDHWHQKISIDAMNAGKDVYCEKPMVQRIEDGPAVIETQRRTGRILQVGSQRVSSAVYQKAKELLFDGAVGKLNLVEAWWNRNSALGAWEYPVPRHTSRSDIDWGRFLGRAPNVPFEPVRFFRWRNYRDYGTGVAGDLFVHLFSGLHFVTDAIGPTRVFATGGIRYWKDRDVPDVLLGLYDYPAHGGLPPFNLSLRVNFVDGGGETSGFRFVGSEGVMMVDGGGVMLQSCRREGAAPKERRFPPPTGYSDLLDHHRNFINSVRTRKAPVEDPVFGFRAGGPALLSNVSYFEQRVCGWNPETMT